MDEDDWNNHLLKLYAPLDALLVLYMTTGIIGNALVLFVYGFKMRIIKDGQYFIPYLAAVDLAGTVVCSLFGLSMTLMPVTFDFNLLCKVGWLFGTTTTMMSVFMLVPIAIQRYIKVCKQKGHILTLKRKKLLMIFALIMSFLISVPSIGTYDIVPFNSSHSNITGAICGKIRGTESLVYDIILGITVSVSCGMLIILYILIGRTTNRYMRKEGCISSHLKSNNKVKYSDDDTLEPSKSTCDTELKYEFQSIYNTCKEDPKTFTECSEIRRNEDETVMSHPKTKMKASNLQKRNQKAISRITIMFMIITLIFLICSVPKMTIVLLETIIPHFWENFSDVERVILMFLHQGFILNNITNPFIYAFLDNTFKAEIRKMFCCHAN